VAFDGGFEIQTPQALIRGRSRGHGHPIILLHGGPGCYDYFHGSALVDWLAAIRTVYSYDQRGCRHSPSDGPFTLAANVADLESIRRRIGAECLDLLGHSAGAVLAVHYAATHPCRVGNLILVSPAGVRPGWRADFDRAMLARHTPEQRERLAAIDAMILRTPDASTRARLYHERFRVSLPSSLDPAKRHLAPDMACFNREVNVRVNASVQQTCDQPAWQTGLRSFTGRAAILHGRGDPIPWKVVDDLKGLLPNAAVFPLDDCGHFPWIEQPNQTRRILMSFLSPAGSDAAASLSCP